MEYLAPKSSCEVLDFLPLTGSKGLHDHEATLKKVSRCLCPCVWEDSLLIHIELSCEQGMNHVLSHEILWLFDTAAYQDYPDIKEGAHILSPLSRIIMTEK